MPDEIRGNTNLDPMQPDGLHRSEANDKMSNEIGAAEDNLLFWQEKYEMEVRREAVTAQAEAKMALEAAEKKLEELKIQYRPEHLTRSEVLPVPPKFKPPLPIITEEIKKTVLSKKKVIRKKKKK